MTEVSVIIPTYNRRLVIGRAIKSVLNQTYNDYELIIVDDGSSDGTRELIQEYAEKDKRIKYVYQENRGASSARNFGIKQSLGEYLAFLDSDNEWLSDFLETMVSVFKNRKSLLMAYCSENLFLTSEDRDINGKIIARRVRAEEYNPAKLLKTNYIDINCVILKRELYDNLGGFDENLTSLEDWDYFARVAIAYPFSIRHVDTVLVNYYYSEGFDTITNKMMPKRAIRSYMGLAEPDELTRIVLSNIDKYLKDR
ncbi:hypothetical protein A2955_04055 [Candidatus Woesebacteria bacterium RIFCSPLOWO2_01_FULL_37_19]|uniref:Glycosyltransferase 2-like domain-containing protein n=1 Tax=Candidatus Woesebacteria bacterium RIFCSPLOWO2_01_FULL_37_19 TaxID=1802514 RepID=A0A1F8B868_9BACT|nr:MAG: hypothetical protein A2955_04055 [Candidatus Woesebacteria bacterium RIFCSPLOWO2_01_FULL_37_19]